jgi:hypothetical protein
MVGWVLLAQTTSLAASWIIMMANNAKVISSKAFSFEML